MPITPAATGVAVSTGSGEESFFSPSANAEISTLAVRNRADSAADVIVRIPELHGAAGSNVGARIPVNSVEYFRVHHGSLSSAYVVGNGGIIDWYGVARTKH